MDPPDGKPLPQINDLYQNLHDIISSAAYLSIRIRASPTIFYLVDMAPGQFYMRDDQVSLDREGWTRSKEAVMRAYNASRTANIAERGEANREVARLSNERNLDTRAGRKALEYQRRVTAQEPRPPAHEYRAMVKIGVWPSVKRFKPGSAEDERREREHPNGKIPLYEKNGSREYEICRAAVVCYYGKTARTIDDRANLADYVEEQGALLSRPSIWWPSIIPTRSVIAAGSTAAVITGAWFLQEQIKEKTGFSWESFAPVVDFLDDLANQYR